MVFIILLYCLHRAGTMDIRNGFLWIKMRFVVTEVG